MTDSRTMRGDCRCRIYRIEPITPGAPSGTYRHAYRQVRRADMVLYDAVACRNSAFAISLIYYAIRYHIPLFQVTRKESANE